MDSIITERPEITIDDEALMHSSSGHVGVQDALTLEDEAPKRRAGKNGSKLLVGASFSVVALAAIGVFAISPYSHFTMADAGRAVSHAEHVACKASRLCLLHRRWHLPLAWRAHLSQAMWQRFLPIRRSPGAMTWISSSSSEIMRRWQASAYVRRQRRHPSPRSWIRT